MGAQGPQARGSIRDWGPPQVGETRRHPPLSCRLGRSRRVLQVLLAACPQGRSQPRGPRQHHTHPPPTLSWAGTLRGHPPHWLPVLVWSYFDAMKRLC